MAINNQNIYGGPIIASQINAADGDISNPSKTIRKLQGLYLKKTTIPIIDTAHIAKKYGSLGIMV